MLKPQESLTRDLTSLDGMWQFATSAMTGDAPWKGPLPGRLEAAVPASFNDQFVNPDIRNHVGIVWYQRVVRIPRGWTDCRILLRVGAASHRAVVYAGDVLVAEHQGGYTPFDAELTEFVVAGQELRLTIGVDNRLTSETIPPGTVTDLPDGLQKQSYFHDFYNYGGLHRSLQLFCTPFQHIKGITVTTDVRGADGIVGYALELVGGDDARVRLLDEDGAEVAVGTGKTGVLTVRNASLWRPGAAYLYRLQAELVVGEEIVDAYGLPVGIRSVRVDGTRFLINGEPFYFTGFGKHEDTPVRGKGHDDAYLVHDFQLFGWIGANSFRTSHYPYAEEVLDFADRQGFVVVAETAAVGLNLGVSAGLTGQRPKPTFSEETLGTASQAALLQHVREVIARDRNHPCIVMWSLANEPASNEDGAREYFTPVVELARELDPTRPLTFAGVMFSTPGRDKIVDLFDVVSLNRYYGWYVDNGDLNAAELKLEAELRGWAGYGKPLMMSEYGADTLSGLHSVWDIPWTEEYQADYLAMNHRVFDRLPAFVGEHVWNFADFRTGPGIHRVDGNKKGVFTRTREPKAAAHALRQRWRGLEGRKPAASCGEREHD